jgi:hypothetical protein
MIFSSIRPPEKGKAATSNFGEPHEVRVQLAVGILIVER